MAHQNRELIRIDCSPFVTHEHINGYVDYCKECCDTDKLLMQKARQYVIEIWKLWREDCEIFCYGDHLSLSFWSGKATNTYTAQVLDSDIKITVGHESCKKRCVSCLYCVANTGRTFVSYMVEKSKTSSS